MLHIFLETLPQDPFLRGWLSYREGSRSIGPGVRQLPTAASFA
jgi:hypothetical protein